MKGFTLIELVIAMGLISILALTASYSFGPFMEKNYLNQAHQLLHDLQYARQTAIQTKQNVTVCASDDGHQCEVLSKHYYMIYLEDQNLSKKMIKVVSLKNTELKGHFSLNSLGVTFNGLGQSLQTGSFYLEHQAHHKRLVILRSGRIRIDSA